MSVDRNSRAARQMRSRGRKPKKRKRFAVWKIALLTVFLFLVTAVGGAVYYVNHLIGKTTDLGVKMEEMTNPNLDIETRKVQKGFWKVAVFGVDSTDGNLGKGANSDVIIIGSLNWETGEIKLSSVYRDTYLKVGEKNPYRKINEAYARGGPDQAISALNENLDIQVDDYVAVNWKAVADAINNLGGVDIEVTDAEFTQINGYITSVVENTGVYSQHLKKPGFQHLDGVQAVAYCRLRKMDTDFQRTERQRKVISQCLEKAKNADLRVINTVIGVCLPQISTSIGLYDLLELGKSVGDFHLGETTGFPFDLKIQDIGKLDCVVPVTLSSNVVKLHEFLFGTENYNPSDHVIKISEDIAYTSSRQTKSGAELHQEDIETMTSATKPASIKEETKESTKAQKTTEESSKKETETEERPEKTSADSSEEREDPDTQSDEYVPDDELINDPGLRTETSTEKETSSSERESHSSAVSSSAARETEKETTQAESRTSESRSEKPSKETETSEENIRPGSRPSEEDSRGPSVQEPSRTGENSNQPVSVPVGPGGNSPSGPVSGNSSNPSSEKPNNGTVYIDRPVSSESEPSGIEGGPGYSN